MEATAHSTSLVDLSVCIGTMRLANPIMVASGTFGYAREMAGLVVLDRLGAVIPKTVTRHPRIGNAPWRTVETPCGLLNSIGLDNDGLEAFMARQLPYLTSLACPTVVSIAGATASEYGEMASRLSECEGVAALELNISCPNVSGGVDLGTNPTACHEVVACVRRVFSRPILAKLTPNVTDIRQVAKAAEDAGADAICAINTVLGMSVNWRKRQPLLGNVMGGLSGPAIKPIALRCVYQVASAVAIPVIGIGGIATVDDVMEFLVTGATAVQIGTASFYRPAASMQVLDELPAAVTRLGASAVVDIVGTLEVPR